MMPQEVRPQQPKHPPPPKIPPASKLPVAVDDDDEWGVWSSTGRGVWTGTGSSSSQQQQQRSIIEELRPWIPKSLLKFREMPLPAIKLRAAPYLWLGSLLDLSSRLEYFICKYDLGSSVSVFLKFA